MAENVAADDAPPKKGKLKLIILIVVVVLLAVGLSVAGTLWFLGGGLPGSESDDPANAEPEFVATTYTDVEDAIVTTVQADGRQRYAQVYLAFGAKDPEALAAVDLHMPLLRSELTVVLGNSDFTELRQPEGRKALAQTMTDRVNQVLKQEQEPEIEQVLFRNFVVQ